MKAIHHNSRGFTLIEMLLAMAVSMVVMGAIYFAYQNHQRSHVTQQLVVEMQQNARAAMSLMKREIRMAGYDPAATDGIDNDVVNDGIIDADDLAKESAGAGFVAAELSRIQFSADFSYNDAATDPENYVPDLNAVNENLIYSLSGTELKRQDGAAAAETVAYDIEAIAFAYAVDEDDDGEIDLSPNGWIQWIYDSNDGDVTLDQMVDTNDDGEVDINDTEGGVNKPGAQVARDRIRAVRIWLLARTRQPIRGHTDNQTYAVGANHRGPADGDWDPSRKRVLLTTTIYCRNMGS